jgi:hypothetical protein
MREDPEHVVPHEFASRAFVDPQMLQRHIL